MTPLAWERRFSAKIKKISYHYAWPGINNVVTTIWGWPSMYIKASRALSACLGKKVFLKGSGAFFSLLALLCGAPIYRSIITSVAYQLTLWFLRTLFVVFRRLWYTVYCILICIRLFLRHLEETSRKSIFVNNGIWWTWSWTNCKWNAFLTVAKAD